MKQNLGLVSFFGFVAGAGSAAAYLLTGGAYAGAVPRWAGILFYPGFFVGNWVFDKTFDEVAAKVAGVLAVGLSYAVLTAVITGIETPAERCQTKSHSGDSDSPDAA